MSDYASMLRDKLEEYGLFIDDEESADDHVRFKIKYCFIFFEFESNKIYLSFDVSTRPDYAALVTSVFFELNFVRNVIISDTYYNDTNHTLFGENAYNKYFNEIYDDIVYDYVREIQEQRLLEEFEPDTIH